MIKDLVSIITPCYNSVDFLEETINSVLCQTYIHWEMFIIDDNSTDSTKNIIEKFAIQENRIKPIFLDSNIGPAEARNFGLKESKGQFIAFLDSDDLWKRNKLSVQIHRIHHEP